MRPHISTTQQRIDWLVKHHKLWKNYSDHSPGWLDIEKLLLERMKKAGLFEDKITILDVSFEALINKARLARSGKPVNHFRFIKKPH